MSTRRLVLGCGAVGLVGLAAGFFLGTQNGNLPAPQLAKADQPGPIPGKLPPGPIIPGDHRHALDPLTGPEIEKAVKIITEAEKLGPKVFFPLVVLYEPPKHQILAGRALPRAAFVITYDRAANKTQETVVDLDAGKIVSGPTPIPGVQPVSFEWTEPGEVLKKDPRWQAAIEKRKLNPEDIQLDSWALGSHAGGNNPRLHNVICYVRGKSLNPYARPIEGLAAVVDMAQEKMVSFEDRTPDLPVPTDSGNFFDSDYIKDKRPPLRPLVTQQPQGTNFEVRGQEVRWQNWRFRVGIHPRDGLVLHQVSYLDGKEERPILYRATLSEMVVPYGDPDGKTWTWRNAFDVGEYGLGQLATTMTAGKEAPAHATLLSAQMGDEYGKLAPKKENVIALYEQDGGLLWTHYDWQSKKTATRRARQLVVQSICTVGNYEYSLKWIFGQDGALEVQTELTGIGLAKGVAAKECVICQQQPDDQGRVRSPGADRYGKLVGSNLVATNHQHFFCFRLDFDVDGVKNSVEEMNVVAEADAKNPDGNAFLLETTLLRTEKEGQRDLNLASHRTWKVFNSGRRNALGHFTGYKLEPGTNSVPYARRDSKVRQRAGFIDHHVWVTPNEPDELYAAGNYPNQSSGGDGLPRWTAGNRPITDCDVVLWYTMGVTHVPRVEEWPIMPAVRAGFRLVPDGFFNRNPALDVPEEAK